MIKCRLKKLSDNKGTHDTEIIGWTHSPPVAGDVFVIVNGDPKSDDDETHKLVYTSIIKNAATDATGAITFSTQNSTYLYERIQDE